MRRHAARVLGYLLRRCSAADAADVWQHVMTIAWQRLDHIPNADDQALAWLIATARRCHANLRRSEQRRSEATQRLIMTIRATGYTAPTHDSPLHGALDQLQEPHREILRLRYWDGLTTEQIAAIMRLRPATCRKRLQRARDELQRRMYQDHGAPVRTDRAGAEASSPI